MQVSFKKVISISLLSALLSSCMTLEKSTRNSIKSDLQL